MVKDTQKSCILMLFKIKFSTRLKKELCNSDTFKKRALGCTHMLLPLWAKVIRLENKFQFQCFLEINFTHIKKVY